VPQSAIFRHSGTVWHSSAREIGVREVWQPPGEGDQDRPLITGLLAGTVRLTALPGGAVGIQGAGHETRNRDAAARARLDIELHQTLREHLRPTRDANDLKTREPRRAECK